MHRNRRFRQDQPGSRIWLMAALMAATLSLNVPVVAATGNSPPAANHTGLVKLNSLSRTLVDKIRHGSAKATPFRTNVVYYRESLRSLMLANEKRHDHKLANDLLMQMVRMAALLQSAAACHTGRYITCPASLMHQLDQQQQQINQSLAAAPSSP